MAELAHKPSSELTAKESMAVHHDDGHMSVEEYNHNVKFAVWLYLASEVVIFSILIAGFVLFRFNRPISTQIVQESLGITLVTINTFILLASSYAMVMGLRAIEEGKRNQFYMWIGATALMGTAFLGGQYLEYSELGHLEVTLKQRDYSIETNVFESIAEVETQVLLPDGTVRAFDTRHTTVVAPDTEFEVIPHEGEEVVEGEIVAYTVDFEDGSLVDDVNLAAFPVESPNEAGDIITLANLSYETFEGETVSLDEIFSGQRVNLAPEVYEQFDDAFIDVLGDTRNLGARFYAPTAFHGAHVLIGVLWALFVLFRGAQGAYEGAGKSSLGVEVFGLYWHFVDVVWIVLFTLIYLV